VFVLEEIIILEAAEMGDGCRWLEKSLIVVIEDSRTGVAGVVIRLQLALCDLEVVLGDDLVEGEGTAAEDLAGVTMAGESDRHMSASIRKPHTQHLIIRTRTPASTDQRICSASGTLAVHSTCPQWQRPLYSVIPFW